MRLLLFTSSYLHWKGLSAVTALHDDPEFSLEESPTPKYMDPNWNVIQYPVMLQTSAAGCSFIFLLFPTQGLCLVRYHLGS